MSAGHGLRSPSHGERGSHNGRASRGERTSRGGWISADALDRLRRIAAGFVLTCVLLALEGVLARLRLPPLPPGGPWLGLLLVLAAGYLFDREHGGALGLFVGFLADCLSSDGVMLRPLSFFLLGWLAGALAHSRLAHNLPSFAVFAAVGAAAEGVFRILSATLSARSLPPVSFVWYSILPHLVMTVLFSPAVYGIVWLVRRLVGGRKKWGM